jgi:hypothetical protein
MEPSIGIEVPAQMDVRIDEPGENGHSPEVVVGARRPPSRYASDLAVLDDEGLVLEDVSIPIEETLGPDRHSILGGKQSRQGERQRCDEDESGHFFHGAPPAPSVGEDFFFDSVSAIAVAERSDSAENVSVPLLHPVETTVGAPTTQRFS